MALRTEVLSLYRSILKTARTWKALDAKETARERKYIREEARTMFKANKHVTDKSAIEQHLKEGHARLQLGLHYQIPYPRPTNFPQHVMPITAKNMRRSQRRIDESKPIYLKSSDKTLREKD